MARPASTERWTSLVTHEVSGITIRAFAEKDDIKPGTLSYWRRRLGSPHLSRRTPQDLRILH